MSTALKAVTYGLLNIASGCGIVFANKVVFAVYQFHFVYALTLVHTLFTLAGMHLFCAAGIFTAKSFTARQMVPLGAAFVGYVVFWNLSLKMTSVGFYQLSKILVMVAVAGLEYVLLGRVLTGREVAAMAMVLVGVVLAFVSDQEIFTNVAGALVSLAAVACSALYQVWAGTKQKQLEAGSMQLMHQYTPYSAALLTGCVVLLEPTGFGERAPGPGTLLGFPYGLASVAAIALSAALGLLVSWSTFLVIGATSSLTFNMVGHLKLLVVLTGGVVFFGDSISAKKALGIALAVSGIVWYSLQGLRKKAAAAAAAAPASPVRLSKGQAPPASPEKAALLSSNPVKLEGSPAAGAARQRAPPA